MPLGQDLLIIQLILNLINRLNYSDVRINNIFKQELLNITDQYDDTLMYSENQRRNLNFMKKNFRRNSKIFRSRYGKHRLMQYQGDIHSGRIARVLAEITRLDLTDRAALNSYIKEIDRFLEQPRSIEIVNLVNNIKNTLEQFKVEIDLETERKLEELFIYNIEKHRNG